jgi:hypothetical protein
MSDTISVHVARALAQSMLDNNIVTTRIYIYPSDLLWEDEVEFEHGNAIEIRLKYVNIPE